MSERCDARQALQKIQSNAFAFEQCARRALDGGDMISFFQAVAIPAEKRQAHAGSNFEDRCENSRAGKNQGLPREEETSGLGALGHAGGGCYVSRAQVFFERESYQGFECLQDLV